MDPARITAELAPAARTIVQSHKAEWLAELPAGRRMALALAWGVVLWLIPKLLQVGVELTVKWVLDRFGSMTVAELMGDLALVRRNSIYVPPDAGSPR